VKRIDVLPDDVLLEIFDFYTNTIYSSRGGKMGTEAWQSLVHVCRRWRSLVLGSPRRLNLRLFCTPETPARDILDIWPALPLIIADNMALSSSTDNLVAALGQSNRVCEVDLHLTGRQLEKVLAPMQMSFPELTDLRLFLYDDETSPVIPDSFLDGSAPRLRIFIVDGILFPGLPKLHLSAPHLVCLVLNNIPHSGYISPEAIVALISALTSLETLSLEFPSPQSRPDWETRLPPPPKRSVLPALRVLYFTGVTEYLEELVARIDTPQLDTLIITFFNQIDFDTPRLTQFISRTSKLRERRDAHVEFHDIVARVDVGSRTLELSISCREPDWQLSSVAQICTSLHPLSTLEDLYIEDYYLELVWKDDAIENTLWLELLLPFTAVENLYLSKLFAPGIAAALQELVAGRITEVLPSLQNIFVEGLEPSGPYQENFGQFVAARQLSDHPIAISVWDKNSNMKSM
jgi:hypothetical protein